MWSAARRSKERATKENEPRGGGRLSKSSPLHIVPRSEHELWYGAGETSEETLAGLHADSQKLAHALKNEGALFFSDIRRRVGLLPSQGERAVAELIGAGLATTDSFGGVRTLLTPESKRQPLRRPGVR